MGTSGQQDGPDRGLEGKWGAQVSRNGYQKGPKKYTKVIQKQLFAKMLADILPSRFVCGICCDFRPCKNIRIWRKHCRVSQNHGVTNT